MRAVVVVAAVQRGVGGVDTRPDHGGLMAHHVHPGQQPRQPSGVPDVDLVNAVGRLGRRPVRAGQHGVDADDVVPGGRQRRTHPGADEPRGTRDEDPHWPNGNSTPSGPGAVGAGVFDRSLVDGLVHQLLERHQVLLELSEHLSGGHPRTGLDARVQVGHQCDCGIADLEFPGEHRLRIAGHVHQREALVREPATLRAGGEPRTLDHHHGAAVDHPGQRGHGGPQRRTVRVGEPDVDGARFEVRVGARPRPVDELIGHHHRPRPESGGEAAHRARREDPAHPQRAQRPHVGAVRHGVRGELVADAVARQERDLVLADRPDGQRRARGAVRRVQADAARIGTEERVETAASDDSQH